MSSMPDSWTPIRFGGAVRERSSRRGPQASLQPGAPIQPVLFRDTRGLECDLIYEDGDGVAAIEVKSGATVASDWFDAFDRVAKALPPIILQAVVYREAEILERFNGREIS